MRIAFLIKGGIMNYNRESKNSNTKKNKIINSKLSIKESFKESFESIKYKRSKLIFSTILTIFALLFLNLFYTLFSYNIEKNYSHLLAEKNEQFIQIEKYNFKDLKNNALYNKDLLELTDDDVIKIHQKIKEKGESIYKLTDQYGSYLSVYDLLKIKHEHGIFYDAYAYSYDDVDIVAINDINNFFNEEVIGRMPINSNEILISNYLADLIMTAGIVQYTDDSKERKDYYIPESYENIITSDKYFYFDNDNKIKLLGIINYYLSKYQSLRNKEWDELTSQEKDAGNELTHKMKNLYNKIYVKKDFIDTLNSDQFVIKTGILIKENTQKGFQNIMKNFKYNESLSTKSTYSDDINIIINAISILKKILFYISIIFLILAISLISNFILSSINHKKEEIMKLKISGNKNSDLIKMFIGDGILIGGASSVLSSIILIVITILSSKILMRGMEKIIFPFTIGLRQFLFMGLSITCIIFISYFIPIIKISKIKLKNIKSNK